MTENSLIEDVSLVGTALILKPTVEKIARSIHRSVPRTVELDDLISSGWIGALRAVDRFDLNFGKELAVFAGPHIRGAILDFLRSLDTLSRNHRRELKASGQAGPATVTLTPDEDSRAIQVEDLRGLSWIPAMENRDQVNRLLRNAKLKPRERKILRQYFFEDLQMKEIGHRNGVNESRVSQIIKRCLNHLRGDVPAETPLDTRVQTLKPGRDTSCLYCHKPFQRNAKGRMPGPRQKFCNSTCYGKYATSKVCIHPRCGKPAHKVFNSTTGKWGGRRCEKHWKLRLSMLRKKHRARNAHPLTPERRRELARKAAQTRLARYGTSDPFVPRRPKELQRVWTVLTCLNLECGKEFGRYVYPSTEPPKYCSRVCFGASCRTPIDQDKMIRLYVDERLPLTAVAQGLGLKDHHPVWKALKRLGLLRTERLRSIECKTDGCHGTPYEGALCLQCTRKYKREWRKAKVHAMDPMIGKRKKGRPFIPRPCKRCGAQCDSSREAASHCRVRKRKMAA